MADLISRQAAIDVLSVGKEILSRVLDDTDVVGIEREKYSWGLELIKSCIKDIEELLSAQPEIVRCKDCKHRMPYDWMFSEVWQSQNMDDYPDNEIGCQYCDMSMTADDFCSRAERREE